MASGGTKPQIPEVPQPSRSDFINVRNQKSKQIMGLQQ